MDPRRWDLNQMLAAYESTLRQGAADEAAWRRMHSELYAEPKEVRRERARERAQTAQTAASEPRKGGMTLAGAEALLAAVGARGFDS